MLNQVQIDTERRSVFYLTFFTSGNRNAFRSDGQKRLLSSALQRESVGLWGDIFGFVIMPNHVHLLVGLEDTGQLREFADYFVSTTSELWLSRGCPLWRATYETVLITSEDDFFRKLHDMHSNPIRRKICKAALDFPHSSASAWLCKVNDGITVTEVDVRRLFGKGKERK